MQRGMDMRILDLDMDYFMTKVESDVPEYYAGRLEEARFGQSVWPAEKVISFLENNLGLSKASKLPGRIVTGHNEALFFWEELIVAGRLDTPFEVVHVDSHADLGLGTDTVAFIRRELLRWPVEERPKHSKHVNCSGREYSERIGDYLLYAIAYRWINKLTYCGNPHGTKHDYSKLILKDFKVKLVFSKPVENTIQLLFDPAMASRPLSMDEPENAYIDSCIKEPEVPFLNIPTIEDVKYNGDFDFVVLAQSPNYTPASADFIMDIFREYIHEI